MKLLHMMLWREAQSIMSYSNNRKSSYTNLLISSPTWAKRSFHVSRLVKVSSTIDAFRRKPHGQIVQPHQCLKVCCQSLKVDNMRNDLVSIGIIDAVMLQQSMWPVLPYKFSIDSEEPFIHWRSMKFWVEVIRCTESDGTLSVCDTRTN